jgi:hypothetical protein
MKRIGRLLRIPPDKFLCPVIKMYHPTVLPLGQGIIGDCFCMTLLGLEWENVYAQILPSNSWKRGVEEEVSQSMYMLQ